MLKSKENIWVNIKWGGIAPKRDFILFKGASHDFIFKISLFSTLTDIFAYFKDPSYVLTCIPKADSGGTRNFFVGGASRGQNAIPRGQKSKNLPKMADFGHFFLLTGGGASGGKSLRLGGHLPPCPPPLDAATESRPAETTYLVQASQIFAVWIHFLPGIN